MMRSIHMVLHGGNGSNVGLHNGTTAQMEHLCGFSRVNEVLREILINRMNCLPHVLGTDTRPEGRGTALQGLTPLLSYWLNFQIEGVSWRLIAIT